MLITKTCFARSVTAIVVLVVVAVYFFCLTFIYTQRFREFHQRFERQARFTNDAKLNLNSESTALFNLSIRYYAFPVGVASRRQETAQIIR